MTKWPRNRPYTSMKNAYIWGPSGKVRNDTPTPTVVGYYQPHCFTSIIHVFVYTCPTFVAETKALASCCCINALFRSCLAVKRSIRVCQPHWYLCLMSLKLYELYLFFKFKGINYTGKLYPAFLFKQNVHFIFYTAQIPMVECPSRYISIRITFNSSH